MWLSLSGRLCQACAGRFFIAKDKKKQDSRYTYFAYTGTGGSGKRSRRYFYGTTDSEAKAKEGPCSSEHGPSYFIGQTLRAGGFAKSPSSSAAIRRFSPFCASIRYGSWRTSLAPERQVLCFAHSPFLWAVRGRQKRPSPAKSQIMVVFHKYTFIRFLWRWSINRPAAEQFMQQPSEKDPLLRIAILEHWIYTG